MMSQKSIMTEKVVGRNTGFLKLSNQALFPYNLHSFISMVLFNFLISRTIEMKLCGKSAWLESFKKPESKL